jgi:hypothetical protein
VLNSDKDHHRGRDCDRQTVTGGRVADHRKQEEQTEDEIREEAATEETDPITSREALEEELMDEGRSEEGEHIP